MVDTFYLFELGSTSLKFYFQGSKLDRIHKTTFPWQIGHEVYQSGRISEASTRQTTHAIRQYLSGLVKGWDPEKIPAFATGALREAKNRLDFFSMIRSQTGIGVRIISAEQEAALLDFKFAESNPGLTHYFTFDLGGGGLQWVHAPRGQDRRWGGLHVGAIRLYNMSLDSVGAFDPQRARGVARELLAELPRAVDDPVIGTGGPVKAVTRVLEKRTFGAGDLDGLELRLGGEGPPAALKEHRRPIYHAGVILLREMLAALGVPEIRYQNLSVGRALLEKVLLLYDQSREIPDSDRIFKQLGFATKTRA